MRKKRAIIHLGLAALMTLTQIQASESPGLYMEGERFGVVTDLDSANINGSEVCTLAVFSLDNLINSNSVVDSTWAEHLSGVNAFTLALRIEDGISEDSAYVDSLWWTFVPESGSRLGSLQNADGSSIIIGRPTGSGIYGPFDPLDGDGATGIYPLRITRGRGVLYLMGMGIAVGDTSLAIFELWKGKR